MDILSNFIIVILVLIIIDKYIKPITFIKKHKNMLYGLVSGLILCKLVKYFRIEGLKIDIPNPDLEQMSAAQFIDDLCNERNSDNATGRMLSNPENVIRGSDRNRMLRNSDNATESILRNQVQPVRDDNKDKDGE